MSTTGPGGGDPTAVPPAPVSQDEAARMVAEHLAPSEAVPPRRWRDFADPGAPFPREPFYRCLAFVLEAVHRFGTEPDALRGVGLVHTRWFPGRLHASVELPRGLVFDGLVERFYRRQRYYEVFRGPRYLYSPLAVAAIAAIRFCQLADTEQMPLEDWHTYLGLPPARWQAPTRVNCRDALRLLRAAGHLEAAAGGP